MMPQLPLMSEDRQRHLLKCAGETIDLVNGGCDPTRALTKVAEEGALNGHEIDRVSTKINQALTLAHIQNAPEKERAGVFPLTNADSVRAELFGKKQVQSGGASRAEDQPDAPSSDEKIPEPPKMASQADYQVGGDFRFAPVVKVLPRFVKTASELPTLERAPRVQPAKTAYENAREDLVRQEIHLDSLVDAAIRPFLGTYGPSFAATEKAAHEMGCSEDVAELLFETGKLTHNGHYRAANSPVKIAHESREYAQSFLAVEEAIGKLAHAQVVREECLAKYRDAQEALSSWHDKVAAEAPPVVQLGFDGAAEQTRGILDSAMGTDNQEGGIEGTIQDAFGGPAGMPSERPEKTLAEKDIEQSSRNTSLRSTLLNAMQDPYVSGHGVPKVIDAINRANGLQPNLSEAELLSYIRQDLATEGGVPLDLQLRAVQAHKEK